MFEKEAEEYADKVNLKDMADNPRETFEKACREMAEYGYNKAKEEDKWHKVHIMEGFVDIPKEGDYLCCLQDGNEFMYEVMDIDSMIWTIDELIAWKEIVPPKEIKEND